MGFGGKDTYNWKLRVSFPVGEESVGAQIVFKAPAEDKRRLSAVSLETLKAHKKEDVL